MDNRPNQAPQEAGTPLRDVAANPEATARYLADLQRVVRDMERHLATLQTETQVHCRDTHVAGDRFYHARLRARPVEKAFQNVLRDAQKMAADLEKAAYNRRAFTEEVKALPGKRREKELEKVRKKNRKTIQSTPGPQTGVGNPHNDGYPAPAGTLYDLRGRESA
ncbi:hypothetical protein [Streptomyces sp. MS2.AVA.5]|uniref:Uncharacterized protein n=1 Tax=Streptomyces achmelvichensis TaxID=3134111 RepID=A0ACC6PKT2_9ACTN